MTSLDALRAATVPAEGSGPARFALVLRRVQEPAVVAEAVATAWAPLAAKLSPLSALEPDVLVALLPDRVFAPDTGAVFAAAYAAQDEFDLAAAEPDLPTGFFPEVPSPGDGKGPAREGINGFPPGCWAPPQPELDDDPRWALNTLRVPQAWAFSEAQQRPSRGEGVIIAQPDTGVTKHAELADVITVPGFDILDSDPDPTDPLNPSGNPGHGTATASVAVSGEARTVCGTAPLARHMAIRAIESVVRVTQVSVAQAIDWAVAYGAQVITMSLGGIPSFSLDRALRRAVAADVIVLAAAGNCVRTVVWPARYDDCIAVAGTDWHDAPWRGSCRGPAVDIAAPGENVLRARVSPGTPPGDEVGQGQGTSFAVALTAGVAALWLAHHGRATLIAAARQRGETLQQMFRRLLRASARRPAGWDPFEFGAGVADAHALLTADLDLGRELESVEPPTDPRERAANSVRSLVAETAGPKPARDERLDFFTFGPELAAALLSRQLTLEPEPGMFDRESAPTGPTVSVALTKATVSPQLRDWLGLDEVGEVAGERGGDR